MCFQRLREALTIMHDLGRDGDSDAVALGSREHESAQEEMAAAMLAILVAEFPGRPIVRDAESPSSVYFGIMADDESWIKVRVSDHSRTSNMHERPVAVFSFGERTMSDSFFAGEIQAIREAL